MKTVLFARTHNAGRSQMAEAFFNPMAPDDVRAESAGQQARREGVWPTVAVAMREVEAEPPEQARSCADAELSEYSDVPVRSFVMAIADRQARECLATGGCAVPD